MLQTASICVLSHVKYHIISSEDYEHVKLEKSIPLNFYNTGSELTLWWLNVCVLVESRKIRTMQSHDTGGKNLFRVSWYYSETDELVIPLY